MRVRFNRVLCNLDGTPVLDADRKEVRLGAVCATALLSPHSDPDPESAIKAYTLATLIYSADEIDSPVEDVARIKAALARSYAPLIAGQGSLMLERQQ